MFTARFIGSPSMNILPGRLSGGARPTVDLGLGGAPLALPEGAAAHGSRDVLVGVRPQNLSVLNGAGTDGADLVLDGRVGVVEPLGSEAFVHVEAGDRSIVGSAPPKALPPVGSSVRLGARAEDVRLFDARTEKAL